MGKLIFITGGARSGKSDFALKLGEGIGDDLTYIATCQPLDDEMRERIRLHRERRGDKWKTVEEPFEIDSHVKSNGKEGSVVLIDCLTIYISNLLMNNDENVKEKIDSVIACLKNSKSTAIIVSNEVGMGIVPDNEISRVFRDESGIANQKFTKESDEAYMMVSGIPIRIK